MPVASLHFLRHGSAQDRILAPLCSHCGTNSFSKCWLGSREKEVGCDKTFYKNIPKETQGWGQRGPWSSSHCSQQICQDTDYLLQSHSTFYEGDSAHWPWTWEGPWKVLQSIREKEATSINLLVKWFFTVTVLPMRFLYIKFRLRLHVIVNALVIRTIRLLKYW